MKLEYHIILFFKLSANIKFTCTETIYKLYKSHNNWQKEFYFQLFNYVKDINVTKTMKALCLKFLGIKAVDGRLDCIIKKGTFIILQGSKNNIVFPIKDVARSITNM